MNINIELNDNEIKKLQSMGYIDADLSLNEIQSEDITNGIHGLIGEAEKTYFFEITATRDVVVNDTVYWEKGCTYTASTNDFTEFGAETEYGDAYLDVEDFAESFVIESIGTRELGIARDVACEEVQSLFCDYAEKAETLSSEHEGVKNNRDDMER